MADAATATGCDFSHDFAGAFAATGCDFSQLDAAALISFAADCSQPAPFTSDTRLASAFSHFRPGIAAATSFAADCEHASLRTAIASSAAFFAQNVFSTDTSFVFSALPALGPFSAIGIACAAYRDKSPNAFSS